MLEGGKTAVIQLLLVGVVLALSNLRIQTIDWRGPSLLNLNVRKRLTCTSNHRIHVCNFTFREHVLADHSFRWFTKTLVRGIRLHYGSVSHDVHLLLTQELLLTLLLPHLLDVQTRLDTLVHRQGILLEWVTVESLVSAKGISMGRRWEDVLSQRIFAGFICRGLFRLLRLNVRPILICKTDWINVIVAGRDVT